MAVDFFLFVCGFLFINFIFFPHRTPYAKNPFDSVSDQELEEYKKAVELSQKGIPGMLVATAMTD